MLEFQQTEKDHGFQHFLETVGKEKASCELVTETAPPIMVCSIYAFHKETQWNPTSKRAFPGLLSLSLF